MNIAYFDCFSGASGNMILGALVDAGLSPDRLREELGKLPLSGYEIRIEPTSRNGIGASRVCVDVNETDPGPPLRHLHDIEKIVNESGLTEKIKTRIMGIFNRLAEAEAKVHQSDAKKVHFHEVGAVDSIIDVAGAVIGLEALNIHTVYASPIHLGTGMVNCAHGIIPVPSPAATELVRGIPVYGTGIQAELLTPTGAAILSSVCNVFGPMPPMIIETVGYGSGTANRTVPNLLRIAVGRPYNASVKTPGTVAAGCGIAPPHACRQTVPDSSADIHDIMKAAMAQTANTDFF